MHGLGTSSWRLGLCRDLDRRVEKAEDPFGRCHRALEDVELLRQIADRPEEALRVLQERDECAQSQWVAAVEDETRAANPENQRRGKRPNQFNRWVEHRVVEDRLNVGVPMLPIDLVECIEVTLL